MSQSFTQSMSRREAVHQVMQESIGGYHATIERALMESVKAGIIANFIEDRCSHIGNKLCGQPMWVRDREEWYPILVRKCQEMLDKVAELSASSYNPKEES